MEPFFRFLADVVTLGTQSTQRKYVHFVLGVVVYAGVVGLFVLAVTWQTEPAVVAASVAGLVSLALLVVVLLVIPSLHPFTRNLIGTAVILGLLGSLVFGGYRIAVAVGPGDADLTLRGDIHDEASGRPVGNVVVSVTGTDYRTSTNQDGRFTLSVSRSALRGDLVRLSVQTPDGTTIHEIAHGAFPVVLYVRAWDGQREPQDGQGNAGGAGRDDSTDRDAAVDAAIRLASEAADQAQDALRARRFARASVLSRAALERIDPLLRSGPALNQPVRRLEAVSLAAADSLQRVRAEADLTISSTVARLQQAQAFWNHGLECEVVTVLREGILAFGGLQQRYPDLASVTHAEFTIARNLYDEAHSQAIRLRQERGVDCRGLD